MNTAHWHLLLNHIPVIGTIIGTAILFVGLLFTTNQVVRRTGLIVLIGSALFAIPAYFTGEGAEEIVENLPGVAESIIERHEETGKIFLAAVSGVGLLALTTIIMDWKLSRTVPMLYMLVLLVAIGTSIFSKQVGTSGGEIRHTEIRSSTILPAVTEGEGNNGAEKDDD